MKKVAVFLSSGAKKREWPLEKYIELFRLVDRSTYMWILLGDGNNTKSYAEKVVSSCPNLYIINLVGQTSLRETCAVLHFCDAYLGGDTGPMHMATAANMSGVVRSCHPVGADDNHVNSPSRFGPWRNEQMKILRPKALLGCEKGCVADTAHCIEQIKVTEVEEALGHLWKK